MPQGTRHWGDSCGCDGMAPHPVRVFGAKLWEPKQPCRVVGSQRRRHALSESLPVSQTSRERKSTTILVVEDELLIRIVLADELRMAGFHALEAGDADAALELLATTPE